MCGSAVGSGGGQELAATYDLACFGWAFVAGNLLMALSADYWMGLCARFVSGLPHGAYFGVGSIVASRLAEKGKSTSAVAIMIMGMTIANLFGVPAGNFLGHFLSWRLVL